MPATKHDFDFLFGSWKIHNRYLRDRLRQSTEWIEFEAQSHAEPLLHGFGHLDRYTTDRDGVPFEGITLRLFDPDTGQWSIHWADTARARTLLPPMVGTFVDGVGEFFGDETVDGKKVLCRFRWTRPSEDSPRWEQAFSEDDGRTWETNWIMTFTRRSAHFPQAVPEIPVRNVDKAAEYYVNVLGFIFDWGNDEGGIGGISQGDCRMFLTNPPFRSDDGPNSPVIVWLNLSSKQEVDELFERWKDAGAKILEAVDDKPWNLREFRVADPDGNQLRVFYDFNWELPDARRRSS